MSTTARENKDLFRRAFDALNERDFDTFAESHAEDVVLHDPDEEIRGIEAVVESEQTIYDAFPDMEYTLEDVLAEDNMVAGRWTATGTHEGEFEGIPPTGEKVEITVSGFLRVDDGKVQEVWLTYDQLGMMQQLGVVEPPTE